MANVGLAPREVRIVILTVAMILTAVMGGTTGTTSGEWDLGRPALGLGLGLIALLATITTIQRILHVVGQSSKEHE
jgi:heme A synthase